MSTLLLSGWAQPADALNHLAEDAVQFDYSDYGSLELATNALKESPSHSTCIAWSMGGVVALHAIAKGAIAPKHLTLIATPYQFIQTPDYKHAMDTFTYEKFHTNYAENPVRAKDRFLALIAKGDRDFKRILSGLTHHYDIENTARWLPWLQQLGRHRLSDSFARISTPTLIIHGTHDAIVPFKQADSNAALLPNAYINRWEETGHAPHIHNPQRLRAEINNHRKAHGV